MLKISKKITGVAIADPGQKGTANAFTDDADRRLKFEEVPKPLAASLRWKKRPRPAGGNPAWTYMVDGPSGHFAVVVGHVQNGHAYPFEVWTMGESPRGLSSIAKSLSMDMRSEDRGWLRKKLETLAKCPGEAFDMTMPDESKIHVPSAVAAFARLVLYRCEELGAFDDDGATTPIVDALMSKKEPKTTAQGGLAWYADVANPITGDDFTLFVKEAVMPDGQRRPLSLWMSGNYPRSLDGLCKALSLDLRVVEVEWGLRKLQQLLDCTEANGGFFANVPGSEKSSFNPSTVAYVAALILHRLTVLGVCESNGRPLAPSNVLSLSEAREKAQEPEEGAALPSGKLCHACGAYAVHSGGGCDTCSACGDSKCG